ncbi:hypothetical protein LshimejAT787_1200630 [Lyophyllum shimeji]|uniref:Uncharacterized protein n=1 Tax=Lyophyllum shimeji TaxID=47721 RepID=A0A9P3PW68_LYOSH|nr:hypothetical protein LshimejAT787_1200630 [Lyophyllum shimeji]
MLASASAVPVNAGAILHGLLARQTDPLAGLPPSCKTSCSTVLTNIQARPLCLDYDFRSPAYSKQLIGLHCVECLVSSAPGDPTVAAAGQDVYNKFDEACSGTGIPSHTLFAPGASSTPGFTSATTSTGGPTTAPPITNTNAFPSTTSPIVQFTVTSIPDASPQTTTSAGTFGPPITANTATAVSAGTWRALAYGTAVGLLVGAVAGIV